MISRFSSGSKSALARRLDDAVWNGAIGAFLLVFALIVFSHASWRGTFAIGNGQDPDAKGTVLLNHDLSTGDLSQWEHRDYGLGTDVGSNQSGAGYLWYHPDIAGRRAVGMTVTPTAHASPAANSDSVFVWDPTHPWNYMSYEIWLRTSVLFPSGKAIASGGKEGEQPFFPTTGEWNWFLEFHNDSNPLPPCAKEYANVALDVKTSDPVQSGVPGSRNVRLAARIMGGNDCAPATTWVNGPALVRDHWYEILLHIKWEPIHGIFEWYLDDFNRPLYSNSNIPTLYSRPAGFISPSYTSLTVGNYRMRAQWNSTIYLGPLVVGASKNAILDAADRLSRSRRMAFTLLSPPGN